MKNIYLAAALAVLAGRAWAAEPPSNTKNAGSTEESVSQKDVSAIKEVVQNLAAAFNNANPKAAADLFAKDAVVINPLGRQASGRDAVQQLVRSDLNGFLKDTATSFTNIQVKMLKPDVAFFDMDQELAGGKFTGGNEAPNIHVSGVAVKRGGTWLIQEARPATYIKEQPAA